MPTVYAVLVDRTQQNREFLYDGRVHVFKANECAVDYATALWLLKYSSIRIKTTDGQFVSPYAIKDGPEDLVTELGIDCLDTSPLEVDTTAVEGWDAEAVDPNRARARVLDYRMDPRLRQKPSDFVNQATAGTFSGKER